MVTKILIADDNRILAEGIRLLLSREPNLEVVGQAGNGHEAVNMAADLQPDLVLMAIQLPELNGIDATRRILERDPRIKVLGLSRDPDRQLLRRMFKAGARGYLLKKSTAEDLKAAIQALLSDRVYLGTGVIDLLVKDYVQGLAPDGPATAPDLTPREREVLQLLTEGKATKEIAGIISISVKTVETHRKNIMDKLGLRSVAELTKYALRHGITTLEE
ncbi:MAG: response regulator transcription factor [Acidobacteria bacterium]|nr:response regulator transcription factor [Acidobacteriota bacterium]